jgi:hypothetical protein
MIKKNKASDTLTQREAEKIILNRINAKRGWKLFSEPPVKLATGVVCQIDGIDRDNKIMCEISARIGNSSASRDKKMVSDSAKMLCAENVLGNGKWKKVLVFIDDDFAKNFIKSKSPKWQAHAIEEMGIIIDVVTIDESLRKKILKSQKLQGLKFKG